MNREIPTKCSISPLNKFILSNFKCLRFKNYKFKKKPKK